MAKQKTYQWSGYIKDKAAFTVSIAGRNFKPLFSDGYGSYNYDIGRYEHKLTLKDGLIPYHVSGDNYTPEQVEELREFLKDKTVVGLRSWPHHTVLKSLDAFPEGKRHVEFKVYLEPDERQLAALQEHDDLIEAEKAEAKVKAAEQRKKDREAFQRAKLKEQRENVSSEVLDVAQALMVLKKAGLKVVTVDEKSRK